MPVPAEQAAATCAHCGAALVADQRYCLSCGQPVSPVRLSFLDALHGEQTRAGLTAPTVEMGPAGYAPLADGRDANGWLRRYSGVLGLLSVLLMCLLVGLLVGHWVTQGNASKAPGKQVVEVKGLSAAPAAAAAVPSTTTPAQTPSAAATETPKETAKEKAEAAKEAAKETKAEKAPPPKPVKVAPAKIKKLTQSSGKKHQEEINSLGATPIETG